MSDGTAVLGLGDIGPEAAMPVMEGKAMLFKEFADVDAFPICLDTKDTDEIVATVKRDRARPSAASTSRTSPSPRCFEIEERLNERARHPGLPRRPARHRDRGAGGAAQRLRLTGQGIEDLQRPMVGAGAAGVAVSRILLDAGVTSIVACDRHGAIHTGRDDRRMHEKQWLAENTNRETRRDGSADVLEGTDLFIGLSGPGDHRAKDLER